MYNISYEAGCCNCKQSDGIRRLYSIINGDPELIKQKTEFEVMEKLELWRSRDGNLCEFCSSPAVNVFDVKINDYPLFNFDRLVNRCKSEKGYLLVVQITKKDRDIKMNIGGSPVFDMSFLKDAILKVFGSIHERPDYIYKPHDKGSFYICISGFPRQNGFDIKIERFDTLGISKYELDNALMELPAKYGISLL